MLLLLDHTARTMYVDVVYCYRPSSVVWRSVCLSHCQRRLWERLLKRRFINGLTYLLTSEPYKNGWTDRDAIWVEDLGEPREPCIRCGSRNPWEMAIFRGRGVPLKSTGTLCGHLCKNDGTCRDAIWVVASDSPMESSVRRSSRFPKGRGNFGGKGRPL